MANQGTPVTIAGATYFVPTQSENPPWGDDLHDAVVALADAASSVNPPGTILLTTFSIANNISSVSNVTGASFDNSLIQSFELSYSLYRGTSTSEGAQVGTLSGTFNRIASTWDMSNEFNGQGGVVFSITSGGQIQYTSSNMGGSSYMGTMKFTATVFSQS